MSLEDSSLQFYNSLFFEFRPSITVSLILLSGYATVFDKMTERLLPLEDEQRFSRRGFLRNAVIGAAVTALATRKLTEGISLNKPPLALRTVSVGRMTEDGDVQLFSEDISGAVDRKRIMTITPEGKLLFEPSGEFFAIGREFRYIHRANDKKFIKEAHRRGANLFDIDANDVQGTVYAEHGIVPQFGLSLGRLALEFSLPAVIDVDEKELKLGMPEYTYEELVAYVGFLSTPENPLAVSTELKRGKFESSTLHEMLEIHQEYNVPAIVHSTDSHQLASIGSEVASAYNAAK